MDKHHLSYITKLEKKRKEKKNPACEEALMAGPYWNKGPEA
jgi:hypothetical protein